MKPTAKITGLILLFMLIGVVFGGWKLYEKEMYDKRWVSWEVEVREAMTEVSDKHIFSLLGMLEDVNQPLDAEKNTPLIVVAGIKFEQNNEKTLRALLDRGANVNQKAIYGFTPLVTALSTRLDSKCIDLLLARGADPNLANTPLTPLDASVSYETSYCMKALLKAGAKIGTGKDLSTKPYIVFAAEICDLELIKLLIKKGANINTKGGQSETALIIAIQKRDSKIAAFLVEHGADVNSKDVGGVTAMKLAAKSGDKDIIEALKAKHVK